jgi:hypothetical protein
MMSAENQQENLRETNDRALALRHPAETPQAVGSSL